jgi:hypothetical protein
MQTSADYGRRTEAILASSSGTVAAHVRFEGWLSCEELPTPEVTGDVFYINDVNGCSCYGEWFENYKQAATYLDVCTYCIQHGTSEPFYFYIAGVVAGGSLALYSFVRILSGKNPKRQV